MAKTTSSNISNFSLVVGGPLYWFFLRTHLARPPLELVKRRFFFFTLLSWLPLVIINLFDGTFLGGVRVPFLPDVATHVRFLFVLPLLIAAEVVVHERIRPIVEQFVKSEIVLPHERTKFAVIVESTMRARNSIMVEILLLVIVFTLGQ